VAESRPDFVFKGEHGMAAFLGIIAVLLGITVASAGLIIFARAGAQSSGVLLTRLGALLLLTAGVAAAVCSGMTYRKYEQAGQFESAYPANRAMDRMEMMRMRRMQRQQMREEASPPVPPPPPPSE
jgi:hypothetical protein